jgi:hypothetical protein
MRFQDGNRQLVGMTTLLLPLSYGVILIFSWLAVSVGFLSNFFFIRSKVATDCLMGCLQALPESTGANDKNHFLLIAIFNGKVPPKQDEISSKCGKGQGQHMEKKSGKILPFLAIFFL